MRRYEQARDLSHHACISTTNQARYVYLDSLSSILFLRHFSKVGCIQYSDHCLKRMAYRNIQVDDLLMVLMWGDIQDVEYDPEYDSWKCRITGKSLDDDDLTFVAAIYVNANAVMCITVF